MKIVTMGFFNFCNVLNIFVLVHQEYHGTSFGTVTSDVSKHKSVDGKHEAEKTNIYSLMDRKIPTGKVE
jgi:hypothetical protein